MSVLLGRFNLTGSQSDLLLAFLCRPGQVLPRDAPLGAVRGRGWAYLDRSIDTPVARLRKKLAGGGLGRVEQVVRVGVARRIAALQAAPIDALRRRLLSISLANP